MPHFLNSGFYALLAKFLVRLK